MPFEIAWKVSYCIHLLISIGAFVFLTFYRFKSWKGSILRAILLFFIWAMSNVICNGCPITHLENKIFEKVYGREIKPNYTYKDSWVHDLQTYIIHD